jgi:hypothetical protein
MVVRDSVAPPLLARLGQVRSSQVQSSPVQSKSAQVQSKSSQVTCSSSTGKGQVKSSQVKSSHLLLLDGEGGVRGEGVVRREERVTVRRGEALARDLERRCEWYRMGVKRRCEN